jgi:T5SS/PEP-CTERM-associated repeat protein
MLLRLNSKSGYWMQWITLVAGITLVCVVPPAQATIRSAGSVNPVPPASGGTFTGQLVVGDAQAANKDTRALVRIDNGSVLQYGTLIIGDEGDQDDPDVFFGELNVLGNFPGTLNDPYTALILSGGGNTSTPTVQVGRDGFGTLNLSGGATVSLTSSSSVFSIGVRRTGVGSVSVTDPFTLINTKGNIIVGQEGVGDLQISDGASVVATGSSSQTITVGPSGRIELHEGTLIGGNPSNGFGTKVDGYLGGSGLVRSSVDFSGAASLGVGAGDVLRFDGKVDNQGSMTVAGGELRFLSDFSNKLRTTDINGNTVIPPGRITLQDGTIRFSQPLTNGGVITSANAPNNTNGDITTNHIHGRIDNAGKIVVASDTVATFHDSVTQRQNVTIFEGGTALFLADLEFEPDSQIAMAIAPGSMSGGFGAVQVAGQLSLAGDLTVTVTSDYTAALGDRFELLTSTGGMAGAFDIITLPELPGNLEFGVLYGPTSVIMEARVAGLPGDYNHDGQVDAADYVMWRDRLGSGTSLANDDTPGVGQDDYDRWRANFGLTGETITGTALAMHAGVPEASGVLLALVPAVAFACRRRR